MTSPAIIGRARSWIGGQVGALTPGQRWTSTLALLLSVSMLSLGMPSTIRVVAAPPLPPVARVPVTPPAPPPVPFVPIAPVVQPPVVTSPEAPEPPGPEPGFTPPAPTLHACATDEMIGAPAFATAAEQLRPIQEQYEAATGQPLGVDLVSVALFVGQCTDALPNAPAAVTLSILLNQLYDALEAAGVPMVQLPDDPPVVSLPDVPGPLQPVLAALAPVTVPACAGVPFFGVTVGISGVFGLAPTADGLLPFPTSEVMPYLWPVRSLCATLIRYAPPPEEPAPAKLGL